MDRFGYSQLKYRSVITLFRRALFRDGGQDVLLGRAALQEPPTEIVPRPDRACLSRHSRRLFIAIDPSKMPMAVSTTPNHAGLLAAISA